MLKYLLLSPLVLAAGCTSVGLSANYVQELTKKKTEVITTDFINGNRRPLPVNSTPLLFL